MRLLRQGTEAHRPGDKMLDDGADGLNFRYVYRCGRTLEVEEVADEDGILLAVHQSCELLIFRIAARPRGKL